MDPPTCRDHLIGRGSALSRMDLRNLVISSQDIERQCLGTIDGQLHKRSIRLGEFDLSGIIVRGIQYDMIDRVRVPVERLYL